MTKKTRKIIKTTTIKSSATTRIAVTSLMSTKTSTKVAKTLTART